MLGPSGKGVAASQTWVCASAAKEVNTGCAGEQFMTMGSGDWEMDWNFVDNYNFEHFRIYNNILGIL